MAYQPRNPKPTPAVTTDNVIGRLINICKFVSVFGALELDSQIHVANGVAKLGFLFGHN